MKSTPPWTDRLLRYVRILCNQAILNREYFYFWCLGTLLHIAAIETPKPWGWILIGLTDFLVGIVGIASVIRPIDKAFESIGLDYTTGYGLPSWIVRGKYPLTQDALRIRAAGYTEGDFERFLPQIASRLNQPIMGVRKVSPTVPEIEVLLKRGILPETVALDETQLSLLSQGEFFVGQSSQGFEKLSLIKMTHMLVAGQTGSGKTQFLRQMMATILTRIRAAHVCLIDMKGGIDFQAFRDAPNLELATSYDDAEILLDNLISLYEKRRDYILLRKKSHWSEFSLKELEHDTFLKGKPIGPVVVVVDELAELSKKATEKSSKSALQEKLATLARLSRFTAIHLVLGTQRPDKSTIDMQSKDNLPTRICFSVPSVTASNLVLGDMSASTLGNIPGRAIFQLAGSKVVQTPLVNNLTIEEWMIPHIEKLKLQKYCRSVFARASLSSDGEQEVNLK